MLCPSTTNAVSAGRAEGGRIRMLTERQYLGYYMTFEVYSKKEAQDILWKHLTGSPKHRIKKQEAMAASIASNVTEHVMSAVANVLGVSKLAEPF